MNEELKVRLQREIADIMARYRAAGYFPSACVRVFDSRETLACACAGEAEENSLFDVASLTKIATATQIFLLIGQEKLELQTALTDALPALREDAYLAERL